MTTKRRNKILILSIFYCLLIFRFVLAANEVDFPEIIPGEDLDSTSDLPTTVKYFYNIGVVVGAFVAVVVMIVSGVIILFSKGNPAKISDAKKRIFGAFLGLLVLGGSYVIINVINSNITDITTPEERTPLATDFNGVNLIVDGKKTLFKSSTPNLVSEDLNFKTAAFEFSQPDNGPKYAAIFFSDTEYRGQCFSSVGTAGGGSAPFKIGSVYIFRTPEKEEELSPVTLINNDNGDCQQLDETKKAFHPKKVEITSFNSPYKLIDDAGHWIESGSLVLTNKKVLVLMETRDKEFCKEPAVDDDSPLSCPHCQIITKTAEQETCYPLKYNYTYNPDSVDTIKPGYITLFAKQE